MSNPESLPGNRTIIEGKTSEHRAEVKEEIEKSLHEILSMERDPKLQKEAEEFDYDFLRDTLRVILAKSRIDPDKINLVPREQVVVISNDTVGDYDSTGNYDAILNYIIINSEELASDTDGEMWSLHSKLIKIIIHEQIHAASFTVVDTSEDGGSLESGYNRFSKEGDFFNLFDEGVDERLANEIALEYAVAHPGIFSPEAIEDLRRPIPRRQDDYAESMKVVEALIVVIAKKAEVSQQAVWQAMIRNKFDGEGLWDPEVREFLNHTMGEYFYVSLKRAKDEQRMEKFVTQLLRRFPNLLGSKIEKVRR